MDFDSNPVPGLIFQRKTFPVPVLKNQTQFPGNLNWNWQLITG
jgi:hypothetical protein